MSNVEHPNHYNRAGALECIDEMVMAFGREAVFHFCICNAWKYRYRSSAKNGEEDIKKSDWYMKKAQELKGEKNVRVKDSNYRFSNTDDYLHGYCCRESE